MSSTVPLFERGDDDVTQYNPEHGLKTIAVSEAAETHWRRAKDTTKLFEAIKTKLIEQAKYVVWRDEIAPSPSARGKLGGRGKKQLSVPKSAFPEGDPGHLVAMRWRKRLCTKRKKGVSTTIDEIKIAEALDEAKLRCIRVCEMEAKGTERGTAGTGEFERYTPAEHIEAVRAVLGTIDLDPASNPLAQQTVKAEQHYTAEDDGLKRMWTGNVFLNPPYHRELQPKFIDKLIEEVKAGRTTQAIVLTNNSTDTEWFRRAAEAATAICFTYGRVNFTTPGGAEVAPTQGQAFFYFGSNLKQFVEVFSKIGFGVTTAWEYRERS
jgi:phage N-6-adenine-methyltransferase